MLAAAPAAMAALQMISIGEDDAAQFIIVEIYGVIPGGKFLPDHRENLPWVVQVARVPGQRGEATTTETG